MKLCITTLSENSAGQGYLLAEWGLSFFIETDEVNVLFDTGKSISAGYNADTLGIDLKQVDKIVLSHSHHDHTGGLREILRKMGKEVEVIAHPGIWVDRYNRREGKPDKYVGMPFMRQELENFGASFNLSAEPMRITDGIMTTGEVPMVTDFEDVGSKRFIKEDGGWKPDKLLDDQALIINTEPGLIVILGCAHRGIINTLHYAQQLTGVNTIHTVVGGAHLIETSEERIWRTIAALKELDVQRLGLCHCTGLPAIVVLAQEFGDRFFFNVTGTSLELS